MTSALIGWSGFVGGTLLKQTTFDQRYRSTDIADIAGKKLDLLVCSGAPAQKWIANREPEADRRAIETLMRHLDEVDCKNVVLISTVDVFQRPVEVDESSMVDEQGLQPYGLHRRMLEKFVEQRFPQAMTIRLPGLVGPGLRKNVIFDFLNDNNLHAIESRAVFQFYPMVNLWFDIQTALAAKLKLVHLTAAPVSVSDIASHGFGKAFDNTLASTPVRYDFRTRHAEAFGGQGAYQYSARETLQATRAYAQSEQRTAKSGAKS